MFIKPIKKYFINRRNKKAEILSEDDIHDIHDLCKKGFIKARGTGQTITNINIEIVNRVNRKIKILIPHGTYFVSTGSHQNMVTRKQYTFSISPYDTSHINVPASCINAELPIPGKDSKFKGVARVNDDLCKFLEATDGYDPMTIQAGVWAITNGYNRYMALNKLSAEDQYGNRTKPITESNVDTAKEILDKLNIKNNL